MAKTRALITQTERDRIARREDVEDIKRYQAISRVRRRIDDELTKDVAILRKHHPGLLEELRDVVCKPDVTNHIAVSDTSESRGVDDRPSVFDPKGESVGQPVKESAPVEAPGAHLKDTEFPAGKPREDCIEAVQAAFQYVEENEKATMREFVQEVMPKHPVGYDVPDLEPGERYRGAWWRRVVKPGLEALPDVERPPRGGSDWKYTGTDR